MMTTVFLDRDGVLNQNAKPHEYISCPDDYIMLDGAAEGVKLLNDAGFRVLLATNQRGIARGIITVDELDKIHSHMKALLAEKGAHLDGVYYCPHNENECNCRKPAPGMLLQAANDFDIDKSDCWMIGDKESDVLCGKNFGAKTVRIGSNCDTAADFTCDNLLNAAKLIIKESVK